jgi:hypothetical protein
MAEAERSHNSRDIVRLTAMASTLDFAARDLSAVVPAAAGSQAAIIGPEDPAVPSSDGGAWADRIEGRRRRAATLITLDVNNVTL